MLNGSILSTSYLRTAALKFTLDELSESPDFLGPSEEIDRFGNSVTTDFIPPLVISGVMIRFNLVIVEIEPPSNPYEDGINTIVLEEHDQGRFASVDPRVTTFASRKSNSTEFLYKLKIEIRKREAVMTSRPSIEIYERTELIARELIGGYRNLISHVQFFFGETHRLPIAKGQKSESDLHATKEDAWRLVCHFSYFSKCIRLPKTLAAMSHVEANGCQGYWDLRNSPDFGKFLGALAMEWRVNPRILRRKIFELGIYSVLKRCPLRMS